MSGRASVSSDALARYGRLVAQVTYKPGWVLKMSGPGGAFVCVFATTPDSLAPERTRTTQHMFAVPTDDLTDRDFHRWLLERLLQAEQHEACEFYTVNGIRPFWPHHQDEGSPYDLVERWET